MLGIVPNWFSGAVQKLGGLSFREWLRANAVHLLKYWLTFLAALTINFFLPYAAPGDPLRYIIGDEAEELSPEERQEILAIYGLDEPMHVQYAEYFVGIIQGDLGTSIRTGQPVTEVILQHLPWTLLLVGTALVTAAVLGTLLGAISAWYEGNRVDLNLMTIVVVAMSMPGFWIGMLLIAMFAGWLGWFPSHGIRSLEPTDTVVGSIVDLAHHLVLPLIALSLARIGGTYLIARGSVLATLEEDYLMLARAKGASDRQVILKHAIPNSLLPIYTRFTLQVGALVGGAVVIETVFSYPGLGWLIFESAIARDYPLLQGAFLILTVTVIGANLVADLTYPFLDPRTKGAQSPGGR